MVATINTSRFSHFPSLPPELRNQIWRDALPEKDGPAMYPYRKGCWCPRYISITDKEYDPNFPEEIYFEFRHDLLDHVEVDVLLVFVNREARSIALGWVHEQGIKMRFREDRQCHVFVRQFDPTYDTLYVALDKVDDFCSEHLLRPFELDLVNRTLTTPYPDLTRIAVPEAVLQTDVAALSEIYDWFSYLRVLFIIVNPQPDFENDGMKVQRRWELESTEGRAFIWNCEDGGFDLEDGEYIGNEALYRQIEEASNALSDIAVKNNTCSFEIRTVFAVRK